MASKAQLEEMLALSQAEFAEANQALAQSPETMTAIRAKPTKPQKSDEERSKVYQSRQAKDNARRYPPPAPTRVEVLEAQVAELLKK